MQIIKWLLKKSIVDVQFCHINLGPFQMDDLMSYKAKHPNNFIKKIFCGTIQTTFFEVFENMSQCNYH